MDLDSTSGLGIFFTRSGASGFPTSFNSPRQRILRDARATQVLFHSKTEKFVVVLDHTNIIQLEETGALPRILESKIRDVEEASGLDLDFNEDWTKIDLPPHMAQYKIT